MTPTLKWWRWVDIQQQFLVLIKAFAFYNIPVSVIMQHRPEGCVIAATAEQVSYCLTMLFRITVWTCIFVNRGGLRDRCEYARLACKTFFSAGRVGSLNSLLHEDRTQAMAAAYLVIKGLNKERPRIPRCSALSSLSEVSPSSC